MEMRLNGNEQRDGAEGFREGESEAWVRAEVEELALLEWITDPGDESRFRLMDRIVEYATSHGCTRVRAEYRALEDNEAMRDFLAQFGFTLMGGDEEGCLWILPVAAYEPMAE
jgi:hypothetical protein